MKRACSVAIVIGAVVVLGACSDPSPTAAVPVPDAALVKLPGSGGGGVGNPTFDPYNTSCTFSESGELACKYKMTGLGKNGSAVVSLIGLVKTTWDCVNPKTYAPVSNGVNELRLAVDITTFADQSGNAKGTLDAFPIDLTPVLNCPLVQTGTKLVKIGMFWVTVPTYEEAMITNVSYSLVSPSVTDGQPDVMGEWALFAVVKTGKALSTAFYSGSL